MNKKNFVRIFSTLPTNAMFLTLHHYSNEATEIANYSIVFHISYENALRKSIQTLKEMDLSSDLDIQARTELISSFESSLNKLQFTPIEEISDAYTRFFDSDGNYIKGVKLHTDSNILHLYGLVVHKKVLMPGIYNKVDGRRPLTIAKDKLRAKTQVGKFRQFRITPNQVDSISVQNLSLLPPE
jgi:hypothetical protein